ncbi:putative colanic acid biosynthesis UDP-glucose lipid carrier transferase [Gillisia sp. Hel_I_86]|uniref:exopolysaccharide biosynthesis polyprenyl glycosylphosphotransferase n=1 Tax=Gillisia sp. Hel_I_86 TaxID=1249981 RepID=UPI00119A91A0|nr:exopolysaccharide biosynthesis polyprenyl glycosylphosphotransferase [Gillisia sp. Hel_I_86]TVZ27513.1 putative colanic acid biosynthesis UDP-glucose lipid carrier transferase [Gillisia sp. Hel_I_86]
MKGSFLIIPFSVVFHLLIINLTLYVLTPETYANYTVAIFVNLAWSFIGIGLNFYSIDRKEKFINKFHKFLRHYFVFSLSYFTLLAFTKTEFYPQEQILVLLILLILLSTYRWLFFESRKLYRKGGGNFLNVVILGKDKNLPSLVRIFNKPDYGYRYLGYFHNKDENVTDSMHLGPFEDSFNYILNKGVDEIYCSVSQFSYKELVRLRTFADNNLIKLKLVPDNKGFYSSSMEFELFENVPVLNLRKSPLDKNYAKYGKRIFDILASSFMIVFVLSWLIPVLFLLNLLESKGPVIFKQLRHGEKKRSFWCYKFRSMAVNNDANKQMCTRNDIRVTKIGKFIRKTSIDELPQFINVFLGDMSIVGPRPHMEAHTTQYQRYVDKYLVRHFVKPGITGLAQVNGYRGEIVKKSDIVNRIRMDIFYLEKWTPWLDLLIIYETIINSVKGDDKAY